MAEEASGRFGLVADLQSRDGTLDKGALVTNAFGDMEGDKLVLTPRPGLGSFAALNTATYTLAAGGMAVSYGSGADPILFSLKDKVFYSLRNIYLPGSDAGWQTWNGATTNGSPVLTGSSLNLGQWLASSTIGWGNPGPLLVPLKTQGGYYWIRGPDRNPTGASALASLQGLRAQPYILAAGTYANGTLGGGAQLGVSSNLGTLAFPSFAPASFGAGTGGSIMVMAGTAAYYYNGTALAQITDVDFPTSLVPGIAYLDSTYYVMTPDGVIYGSDLDDPTSWTATNFITAEFEPDGGVCLAKALNYVVAFGQWTTSLFWDAANATGSPLSPVNNGVLLVGCAAAGSVAQTESTLIWIAQRKGQGAGAHKGRFIAMLADTSYVTLSTPDVDRVLEADSLATVLACTIELEGHSWYVLSLVESNITLVFDLKAKKWYRWTRLAAAAGVAVTSATLTAGVATIATGTVAHGLSDGDPVILSGATPSGYNGTRPVNVTGTAAFTFPLSGTLGTSTTGTAAGFTEGYFHAVASVGLGNRQVIQDAMGDLYELSISNSQDLGSIPINVKARTGRLDYGSDVNKFCSEVALIGDLLANQEFGLLRSSDDDYQSSTYYKRFDLSEIPSTTHRWGYFRRRSWEWRYTGTARHRVEALEASIIKGAT